MFLAWFRQEKDKPLAVIRQLLEENEKGKFTLYVSAICLVEVLDEAGGTQSGTDLKNFIKRTYVDPVDADFRIASLAADFRKRHRDSLANPTKEKSFKAPDALIAATAVVYRAVLHTFDPLLISLDGSPILDGLRVSRPTTVTTFQPSVFDDPS